MSCRLRVAFYEMRRVAFYEMRKRHFIDKIDVITSKTMML